LIYIDTSVIVKLYIREDYSREISDWLKANNEAIPLTRFHELEFSNAIQLKQFRAEISAEKVSIVISKFDEHEKKGIFYRPQINWPDTLSQAIDLSKKHSKSLGTRSLDIIHVASALKIKADRFLTLDERQSELASVAGLKIEKVI
jgi:predicted nucleic acid-binding protein